MTEQLNEAKSALRTLMSQRLAEMTDAQRHELSAAACQRLATLAPFVQASTVMLYMPLPAEVDLTPAALRCFQRHKTVCVPAVDWRRNDMRAVEATTFDDEAMELDERGLRTPAAGRPVLPESIDVVVVPGLAFDMHGRRLGRGGGFYDRFLARMGRQTALIGLAYDVQIVDEVPTDATDARVDYVVTDRRSSPASTESRPSV